MSLFLFLSCKSKNFLHRRRRKNQPIDIKDYPPTVFFGSHSIYHSTLNGPHSLAVTRWLSEIWGTPNICWVDGGHVAGKEKVVRRLRIILSFFVLFVYLFYLFIWFNICWRATLSAKKKLAADWGLFVYLFWYLLGRKWATLLARKKIALRIRIILSLDGWFSRIWIFYTWRRCHLGAVSSGWWRSISNNSVQQKLPLTLALRHAHCAIIGQLLTLSSS